MFVGLWSKGELQEKKSASVRLQRTPCFEPETGAADATGAKPAGLPTGGAVQPGLPPSARLRHRSAPGRLVAVGGKACHGQHALGDRAHHVSGGGRARARTGGGDTRGRKASQEVFGGAVRGGQAQMETRHSERGHSGAQSLQHL